MKIERLNMKYRQLGKTGLMVSELGLGTAQLAGPATIAGKPSGFKPVFEEESKAMLRQAFLSGVNFVDTGDNYGDGRAETLIGMIAKEHPNVIIATKCGLTKEGTRDFSENYILSCLDGSMKRLQKNCIDVFQLTKPSMDVIKQGEIFDTFDKLKAEGKIRFSGVSIGSAEEGFEVIGKVDTIQVMYNLLDRSAEELIEKAAARGTGIIIRSPLSTGLLTGKITADTKFEDYDYRKSFLTPDELKKRMEMIDEILRERGIDRSDLVKEAFKFLIDNKNISTIIAGASRIDQVIDNIDIVNSYSRSIQR